MRIKEIITEAVQISQSVDGGELTGYVTNTTKEPQLKNYLLGQGADENIVNKIAAKYPVVAILRNMYVDEDMRGQGLGNDLVGMAIDGAANNGANAIVLVADTHEENAMNLVKWYEGFGFEVVGDAGGDPIMVMEL